MKGGVFDNLPALKSVSLNSNRCIDRHFFGEADIKLLSKTVNGTCGIDDTETQVQCEAIQWSRYLTCVMYGYSVIKNIGYTISDPFNEKVASMQFNYTKILNFFQFRCVTHSRT